MGQLQRMMARDFTYWDINNSVWFNDLYDEGCRCERCDNRIYIYFNSEEEAQRCVEKCIKRNINYTDPMYNTFYKTFRVDILMNWKERRPSRLRIRKEQILD